VFAVEPIGRDTFSNIEHVLCGNGGTRSAATGADSVMWTGRGESLDAVAAQRGGRPQLHRASLGRAKVRRRKYESGSWVALDANTRPNVNPAWTAQH
jgi:hypothetical protein